MVPVSLVLAWWWYTGREQLNQIALPDGFTISTFATDLPAARQMALGPDGTVYVGSRAGNVYAVADRDGDGRAERRYTIATGLALPSGVAVYEGALYVGAVHTVLRFDDIGNHLDAPRAPDVVRDDLPTERLHGWKFIAFGPDGWLYVPVGAPCNVCLSRDARFASILRLRPDGADLEVFARGIRNTVGFDWHPSTQDLWFTDNGRDFLGDDAPPDELDHAPAAGMHFGFPHCHGADIRDEEYGVERPCTAFTPPALALDPHVAAIGMRFYTGTMFPPRYRGGIFIAEHGSWNSTRPVGYRVTFVRFADGRPVSYEPFAEGWLRGRRAWGRPADVLVMPDGALLVSDERRGALYRISSP